MDMERVKDLQSRLSAAEEENERLKYVESERDAHHKRASDNAARANKLEVEARDLQSRLTAAEEENANLQVNYAAAVEGHGACERLWEARYKRAEAVVEAARDILRSVNHQPFILALQDAIRQYEEGR